MADMSEHTKITDINSQHYGAIDGLRTYSAIGIVLMHVLANGKYELKGFVFEQLIPSFGDLVFLFMIISCFSLSCGYYEKIHTGSISLDRFYSRRYSKIWPFFAFWCLVDVALSPSLTALYEAFANLTLCFGLLPNAHISVIGVGWFLGVVFVFYLMYPFVCWLLSDKRRAWLSFSAALGLNWLCQVHFNAGRTNFIYCAVFFLAGGLVYLYRVQLSAIAAKAKWLIGLLAFAVVGVYFRLDASTPVVLLLFCLELCYILDGDGRYFMLNNRVTKFLGGISMEIYLCHMVVFRILEKLKLTCLTEVPAVSYVIASILTLAGTILLSLVVNKGLSMILAVLKKCKPKGET